MDKTSSVRTISPARLQAAWERGVHQPPLVRALVLLQLGHPDSSLEELARFTISQRDWHLIQIHEQLAGSTFEPIASCPECKERIEFSFRSSDLVSSSAPPPNRTVTFQQDGYALEVRFPTTEDLLSLGQLNAESLIRRCLVPGQESGTGAACELNADALRLIEGRMAEEDPLSDLRMELACPQCTHRFSVPFDIARYLWQEVDERARKLFQETHTLARFYGWSESEILGMSHVRRQVYLEMVVGG